VFSGLVAGFRAPVSCNRFSHFFGLVSQQQHRRIHVPGFSQAGLFCSRQGALARLPVRGAVLGPFPFSTPPDHPGSVLPSVLGFHRLVSAVTTAQIPLLEFFLVAAGLDLSCSRTSVPVLVLQVLSTRAPAGSVTDWRTSSSVEASSLGCCSVWLFLIL
jgi:hypothetical protein